MTDPVAVEVVDRHAGTVRFTLTCGDCGERCALTIDSVPAFTRQVALSLFASASSTPGTPRMFARCARCDRLEAAR